MCFLNIFLSNFIVAKRTKNSLACPCDVLVGAVAWASVVRSLLWAEEALGPRAWERRGGRGASSAVVGTKGHNLLGSGYEWLQQIDQEGFPLSMKIYEISLNATPAILQKNLIGAINQGGTDLLLTNHSDLA